MAPRPISVLDRLRIERVVWSLDQRLYDLPTRSRIAKRREVRSNLLTAARDIGTAHALRNLGSPRRPPPNTCRPSSARSPVRIGCMPHCSC